MEEVTGSVGPFDPLGVEVEVLDDDDGTLCEACEVDEVCEVDDVCEVDEGGVAGAVVSTAESRSNGQERGNLVNSLPSDSPGASAPPP